MLVFGAMDVARAIDRATLARGRAVQANGQVIDVKIEADGSLLFGRVQGSEPEPYEQWINLRPSQGGIIIGGICTCPVEVNCKHVAAILIEAQRRWPPPPSGASLSSPPTPGAGTQPGGLSPHLQLWLGDFDEACGSGHGGNDYPANIKQRLIYVLEAEPGRKGFPAGTRISPMVAALRKHGDFGRARPYAPGNIHSYQSATHLRRIDHEILADMDWLMRRTAGSTIGGNPVSADAMWGRVLLKILSTGRCRWGHVNGPILDAGPARRAILRWHLEVGARQSLLIEPDGGPAVHGEKRFKIDAVLATAPPFYVDLAAGVAGALDLGLPDAVAARVVAAPVVASAEAAAFAHSLGRRLASHGLEARIPLPIAPRKTEVRAIMPRPRLELFLAPVRLKPQYAWYVREQRHQDPFQLPLARLSFDYAGEVVPIHAKGETLERMESEILVVIPRDTRAEVAAFERLGEVGLKGIKDSVIEAGNNHGKDLLIAPKGANPYEALEQIDDPSRFIAFSAKVVPVLRAEGWQVIYADDYPYRIAEGEVAWWAGIGEGSGIDWFSFELGIEFEGQRINLAPQLASILSRLPEEVAEFSRSPDPKAAQSFLKRCQKLNLFHTLPDGRLLPLPAERLAPILRVLFELIGPRADAIENERVKLHRAEAALLAEGLGSDVVWAVNAERLIALGRELKRGWGIADVTPPSNFKGELRPYQATGLSWIEFLRANSLGGVLADDMGLGKTVQALAFIAREKAEGRLDRPALIVAPTSVLPNWQAEAKRFAPSLNVLALRGLDRKQMFSVIARYDVVLTTYPLLIRDHSVLLDLEFHVAILDEAQAIKNPRATVSGLAHRIKSRHRLALTGTPLENNLGEVWSLFEFLSPGLLGDEATFRRTFRTPIEKHGDKAAQAFLTRRLKPFMLRRTKHEVATELPAKTEIIERVRLEGAQRDLYETVRVLMHEKVRQEIARKGLAKSHIIFLDALLKLRQICCDPRLLKMPQARTIKQSAKLERLMQMIPQMVAEGRKILLFSQFTSMLELIETELIALDIPYVVLTGDTLDRTTPVEMFQTGVVPLFLLSLKAGGTGLNLTAADTVIHYDPWWNPAVENQATDRAHRIGQTKPVFVYKLIVEEGIEEAIEILKGRKAALANALFEGASKSGLNLTEADIAALFVPLDRKGSRRAA